MALILSDWNGLWELGVRCHAGQLCCARSTDAQLSLTYLRIARPRASFGSAKPAQTACCEARRSILHGSRSLEVVAVSARMLRSDTAALPAYSVYAIIGKSKTSSPKGSKIMYVSASRPYEGGRLSRGDAD